MMNDNQLWALTNLADKAVDEYNQTLEAHSRELEERVRKFKAIEAELFSKAKALCDGVLDTYVDAGKIIVDCRDKIDAKVQYLTRMKRGGLK